MSYWIFVSLIQKQVQFDFETRPSDEKPHKSCLRRKKRSCFEKPGFYISLSNPLRVSGGASKLAAKIKRLAWSFISGPQREENENRKNKTKKGTTARKTTRNSKFESQVKTKRSQRKRERNELKRREEPSRGRTVIGCLLCEAD